MVNDELREAEPAGRRVLPAFASDDYFSLLPGEERSVTIKTPVAAGPLQVTLAGWNAAAAVPVAVD
jgi:hypothetical protein